MTNTAQAVNVKSHLLSDEENEDIFRILGLRRCRTLCTTVGQLNREQYESSEKTVIICFVKDFLKRSYFLRVYDREDKTLMWEHDIRLHKSKIEFKTTSDGLLAISEQNDTLKFSDEKEADMFKAAVEENLAKQRARRGNKFQHGAVPRVQPTSSLSRENCKMSKREKKRLSKENISAPTDFRHVGWSSHSGTGQMLDPEMKKLLEQIGIGDQSQVDQETMDFIYDFVDKHGGLNAVQENLSKRKPSAAQAKPTGVQQSIVVPPSPPPSRKAPPQTSRSVGAQPPLQGEQDRSDPPPASPERIARTGPPALPPPMPGKIDRTGPLPPPPSLLGSIDRTRPPPPPPLRRTSSPHCPPPPPREKNRKVPLPPLPGEVKVGVPPPALAEKMECKGPSPLPGGFGVATSPQPPSSNESCSDGSSEKPLKQQIMQLFLQNPGEMINLIYDVIEKSGGLQEFKIGIAGQNSQTDPVQGKGIDSEQVSGGITSDTVHVDASRSGSGDEVPGRRGPDTDTISGGGPDISSGDTIWTSDDELASDFLDDDGEWDD